MSGFVYLWRDKKNKRFYVGSHWGQPDDRYICSSVWMRKAHRRRPTDFKRRILAVVTSSRLDLFKEEERWLKMIKPAELKVRYFNLKITGETHAWHARDDQRLTVAQKISKALTGKKRGPRTPEAAAASTAGLRAMRAKRRQETGWVYDEETRARLGNAWRGKSHTEQHKQGLSSKLRAARAANPEWDKVQDKTCAYCGTGFKGRDSQKHCSAKCRANHWYHARNSAAVRAVSDR